MAWADAFKGDIVTTQWVLTEVADAFARSATRRNLPGIFAELNADSGTRIIAVAPQHFTLGLALYGSRPDKGWSLTDCISFVVMEENGLREALTGDRHFSQSGFVAVFAD